MKSVAELKRALRPGVQVTLIRSTLRSGTHKNLNVPRTVEKAQTNSIMFSGGSWLSYDKANKYQFTDRGFIVDCSLDNDIPFTQVLEYVIGERKEAA